MTEEYCFNLTHHHHHDVLEDEFELLIPLPTPLQCWDYRHSLFVALGVEANQGSVYARQALSLLSYILVPNLTHYYFYCCYSFFFD